MATSTNTSAVYIHVIEDVVNKVHDEFLSADGPGEIVLNQLQAVITYSLVVLFFRSEFDGVRVWWFHVCFCGFIVAVGN